jgi:Predicted amidophosphoribosyltransferases
MRFPCSKQQHTDDTGDRKYKWAIFTEACDDIHKQQLANYLTHVSRTLQIECTLDACTALSWYSTPPDTEGGAWCRTAVGDCLNHAKYCKDSDAQDSLVEDLERAVMADPLLRSATAICAVPALPSKPFDLPHEIAVSLAKRTGITDSTSGVKKIRETGRPMKKIDDHEEKIANINGVFEANPAKVAGERLILIDDTIGSGVTLWAAAKALYAAGAAAVFGLTCCKNRGSR